MCKESAVRASHSRNPLVSVIIPAFNARPYIMDAIRSVRQQEYSPVEILLIDDGSTDGTADLVAEHAPEVRIIRQVNGGVSTARNTGLQHANGEFITFLDADDGWFPGKLHAQLACFKKQSEFGIVFHRWQVWRPDSNGVYQPPDLPSLNLPEQPELSGWLYLPLLLDCVVHTSTVMIRRSVVEQVGLFDTDLTIGEDYDYWLRASRVCQMRKLPGVFSYYRAAPASLTSTPKTRNFEYLVLTRALSRWGAVAPDGKELPRSAIRARLAKLSFDFAYAHLRSGSARLSRQASLMTLRHDPLRFKAFLFLVFSFLKRS